MRVIASGEIPSGSVLIIDSLRSLRLDSTDGLYETCSAIHEILAHGVGVVLLDSLCELKPSDDFMESFFRIALYGEAASYREAARARAKLSARARNRA
jgi:hypothetical protein